MDRVAARPVLSVRRLVIGVEAGGRPPRIERLVDDVSFDVAPGAVLGVLGESGSGKSLIALTALRLLPEGVRALGGEVVFEGRDLSQLSEAEMRGVRGRGMSIIFQEPALALSASGTVGWHLEAALRAGGAPPRGTALRQRARALLARVELSDPDTLLGLWPFQLSAGMQRRVLIAMALAARPRLLIADEPTAGLDAPVQAQILDLLSRLVREEALSSLFITHDPEVIAEVANDVIVLHGGRVIESGATSSVLSNARHPYTRALVEAVRARRRPRVPGKGGAPAADDGEAETARGSACTFAPRCPTRLSAPERYSRCSAEIPELEGDAAGHRWRCFYPGAASVNSHD